MKGHVGNERSGTERKVMWVTKGHVEYERPCRVRKIRLRKSEKVRKVRQENKYQVHKCRE